MDEGRRGRVVRRLRVCGCLVLVVVLLGPGLFSEGCCAAVSRERVVLVTGFEPFGDFSVNPSGEIAAALDGMLIGDAVIVGIVLPVNFTAAVGMVCAAIDLYDPVLVVSTGLNARLSRVAIEHRAVNLRREPWGLDGWVPPRRLDPEGPWVRSVSIPVEECVDGLREADVPVRGSWWAGAYVCNAVLYGELGYVEEHDLGVRVGFVHVPLLDSQGPEGLPLAVLVSGVRQVVCCSLSAS